MIFDMFCGDGLAALSASRYDYSGTVNNMSVRVTFPSAGTYYLTGLIVVNTSTSSSSRSYSIYEIKLTANNAQTEKINAVEYKITASANGYVNVTSKTSSTNSSRSLIFVAGPSSATFS